MSDEPQKERVPSQREIDQQRRAVFRFGCDAESVAQHLAGGGEAARFGGLLDVGRDPVAEGGRPRLCSAQRVSQ